MNNLFNPHTSCSRILRKIAGYCGLSQKPYSTLYLHGDEGNWSISWDAREIGRIINRLGIRTETADTCHIVDQGVFYFSKYVLGKGEPFKNQEAYLAYYHGYPGDVMEEQREMFGLLAAKHRFFRRIQVTHRRMHDYCLEAGIPEDRLALIRIGINHDFFAPQTPERKRMGREKYGIPQEAIVIGSFQKDGNGWGRGDTPKLIKGPDVLLATVDILKERIPELFVLLSGPARGYVMDGLERMHVPYRHVYVEDYQSIGLLFHCLDVYIVSSREEGGPKAIFEAMASGIPLVSTRVGQATDVIDHGKNGFLAGIGQSEALAEFASQILDDSALRAEIVNNGVLTAAENTYDAQFTQWKNFFAGSRLFG